MNGDIHGFLKRNFLYINSMSGNNFIASSSSLANCQMVKSIWESVINISYNFITNIFELKVANLDVLRGYE